MTDQIVKTYRLFCRWGDGNRWHQGYRFATGVTIEHAAGKVEALEPGIEIVGAKSSVYTDGAKPTINVKAIPTRQRGDYANRTL